MPENSKWNHKLLREKGSAAGKHLFISTNPIEAYPSFIMCSSDQMLLRCLASLPEAMLQWLEVESEDLVLTKEKSPEQQIIVSYEGIISDFIHMLGTPLYVIHMEAASLNEQKALPLPADVEQAIQSLIRRKRRQVILNERGSFKIVKKA